MPALGFESAWLRVGKGAPKGNLGLFLEEGGAETSEATAACAQAPAMAEGATGTASLKEPVGAAPRLASRPTTGLEQPLVS